MNPANDTPRSDSEYRLCCNCHTHPQDPTEAAPPDLCWYHRCGVRAESMQASQDMCRSTQKGCTMGRKKLLKLKIKNKQLWVCSQLCHMLPFLSSVPALAVLGLDHQSTTCNGPCCYLRRQAQHSQRGGRFPVFHTLFPELAEQSCGQCNRREACSPFSSVRPALWVDRKFWSLAVPVLHWQGGWHSVTSTFTNSLHTVLISASLSLTDFSWCDTWFPSEQPTHLIPGLHFFQFSIFHPQHHWLLNTKRLKSEKIAELWKLKETFQSLIRTLETESAQEGALKPQQQARDSLLQKI